MAKEIAKQAMSVFEQIRQTDENGNEFWAARQLAKALEYTDFRNFQSVIEKAKEACINSGQKVEHHIVEFNEEITHGKGCASLQKLQIESLRLLPDCSKCRSFKRNSCLGANLFCFANPIAGNKADG